MKYTVEYVSPKDLFDEDGEYPKTVSVDDGFLSAVENGDFPTTPSVDRNNFSVEYSGGELNLIYPIEHDEKDGLEASKTIPEDEYTVLETQEF